MANHNWDIIDASQLLAALAPPCRDVGYVLSLYGSVLTECAGDDLDVIATPFRGVTNRNELALTIDNALGHYYRKMYGGLWAPIHRLRGECMSNDRCNLVWEVPFTRIFTRGWLQRKLDVVVYKNRP